MTPYGIGDLGHHYLSFKQGFLNVNIWIQRYLALAYITWTNAEHCNENLNCIQKLHLLYLENYNHIVQGPRS